MLTAVRPTDRFGGMVVCLVTGSRRWWDGERLFGELERVGPDCVVHGGAEGADGLAGQWARQSRVSCVVMPASWERLGRAAGTIRNGHMIEMLQAMRACGWVVRVLAFPASDSKGTWDCVKRAEQAGFDIKVMPMGDQADELVEGP